MLPRVLAVLLAFTSPALAGGSGSQGSGTTTDGKPAAVPGTSGVAAVPGTEAERGGGPGNAGSAAPPGSTRSGGGTGTLPSKDVTSGGNAADKR